MNESGWIAFSTGRDQQLPRRTRVSCRAHQRRPLVPSAAGEARAGHARAATAPRAGARRPVPGTRRLIASCFGRRRARIDRQVPKCFCLVRGSSSGHKLDHVLPFFFLCRGIELARLLLEQDYSESKQASTHGSSNISFANMCNSSYCCKLEVTNSGVHLTESYGG